jgi:hypothetical protein
MTLEHIDRFSWIFWNYHFKSKENIDIHSIVLEQHFRSSEAAAHNVSLVEIAMLIIYHQGTKKLTRRSSFSAKRVKKVSI